jgi:nucleoside-diphosphate-sugar epimerase
MLARACRGAPIPIVGAGNDELCPLHVDDALGPLVVALSASAASNRTYTLAGDCASVRQIAEACVRACGSRSRSRIVGVPEIVVAAAAAASRAIPLRIYPDQLTRLRCAKPAPSPSADTDLGFAPRPLSEGLARTAETLSSAMSTARRA